MSPWLWTESKANVRWITLDSLLPTLTPGINGRQFGVHALDHPCPRLTRSRIQPRSNFRDGQSCPVLPPHSHWPKTARGRALQVGANGRGDYPRNATGLIVPPHCRQHGTRKPDCSRLVVKNRPLSSVEATRTAAADSFSFRSKLKYSGHVETSLEAIPGGLRRTLAFGRS